jgi:hypothetical protein
MTTTFAGAPDRPNWSYLAFIGLIPGVTRVAPLGWNADIDVATVPEDVWSAAEIGVVNGIDHKLVQLPPAGGLAMEAVSDSAADSAAGTGLRTLTISYLDASYVAGTLVVTLNGTTPVALAPTILRINNAIITTAGSSEVNAGNISIRAAGGLGATYAYVRAGHGILQSSLFTVPANQALDVFDILTSIAQVDTTQRAALFSLIVRFSTGRRVAGLSFGFTSNVGYYNHTAGTVPFNTFPAGTDIWVRVDSVSANNTAVSAALLGLLR